MRWLCCVGVLLLPVTGAAAEATGSLGAFAAQDYRGRAWSEQDFADAPVLVVAFLGVECPLAKLYGPRLQQIANDYAARGVRVVGVDANRHDSVTELAAYARQHELQFPILKDLNNVLADRLHAERTPEVFVLDRERKVVYRGRVDDQYAVGGKSRPTALHSDLRAALDDVLAQRPVKVAKTDAVGCLIGRVRPAQTDAAVTYSKDIAPLLQARCVECHRPGEIAPFALTDYAEVSGWAEMIAEVTAERRMPPWHADPKFGHFVNENRLTDDELQLIRTWVAAGAPEGNPADLPPPKTFVTGWQLEREPDRVVAMGDKPFAVKAEGEVRYQYFSVDPGFKEDVWLNAAEVVPGNRAVVHHVIVFASTDNSIRDDDRQMVTAYVPGLRIEPLPKGMAKKVAAGSKLIFQVHYTPIGTPQTDLTKVGLYFVKDAEVTHEVQTISARNLRFRIEPQKSDQAFTTSTVSAPADLLLLSMSPHMHLRGQSFRYEVTWPNGQTETLLDVPRYDFNWQTMYRLTEPKPIPAGTKLVGYAKFDNSKNNLANPDPNATVTWGDQSWEEMMIGYADVAFPRNGIDPGNLARELRRGNLAEVSAKLFESLDKNRDGKLDKSEAEGRLKDQFNLVDTDRDGSVTAAELAKALDTLRKAAGR